MTPRGVGETLADPCNFMALSLRHFLTRGNAFDAPLTFVMLSLQQQTIHVPAIGV
jgi:hypothetical protein